MQGYTNGDNSQAQEQNGRVKVPTVQEALPYTPFTSVLPFDTSMIQMPAISGIRSQNIRVMADNRLQASKSVLEQLSEGADRAEMASTKCQQTIKDVKRLLQVGHLKLQFRKPVDRPGMLETKSHTPVKLSKFGRMVLDDVNPPLDDKDIVYDEIRVIPRSSNGATPAKSAKSVSTPSHSAPVLNGHIHTQTPVAKATIAVLPQSMDTIQPARQDSRSNVVRIDEKAKGEASVRALSDLLEHIFEADDLIMTAQAGDRLSDDILATFYFQDAEPSRLLAPAYQSKLENGISKCASAGRLDAIPTDDLKRVQSLCDSIVKASHHNSLRSQDDWSDEDVDNWEQNLRTAEGSLLGVRVVLRIMTAGSSNQELQSEDQLKSLLAVIRNIAESCIVPIVELHGGKKELARSSFSIAQEKQELLILVLRGFTKAVRTLTALLAKVKTDESAISTIVYVCKLILFAENATHDHESIFGVQTFEASRRYSMDLIARIFDKYSEQRQFIFDEVLLSLEKLPATKQSARQYRISDAKPIQLVSALIMQLIQASATIGGTRSAQSIENADESDAEDAEGSEDDLDATDEPSHGSNSLKGIIDPLNEASRGNAIYVTNILVQRALSTSKNADEPHRKLLDIFTDDFLAVLGLPEWPAAELLLRSLLLQMLGILDKPKSTTPARNFALESLGRMGSGILEFQQVAQRQSAVTAQSESNSVANLREVLAETLDSTTVETAVMLELEGPYRTIVEYLWRKVTDNMARTALGCHLLQWGQQVCGHGKLDHQAEIEAALRDMLKAEQWLETHAVFESVSYEEVKLATICAVLNAPFCKAFNKIFNVLLTNTSSEHSTVKSRSLKSVFALIETDPSILERSAFVLRSILRCLDDGSSLVRDSALGLIARCIALQPQLDLKVFEHVIRRLEDSAVPVKKRAIKMLKEMYLHNDTSVLRAAIATSLIRRSNDHDESVVDLVKQTIEDIWFQPFYRATLQSMPDAGVTVAYQAQSMLLVSVVEASDEVPDALAAILTELLVDAKNATDNQLVAKKLVACLFDGLIGDVQLSSKITQGMILQVLAVVAQASPKLITASQMELLDPYTKNLTSNEDLTIFRLALTILRHAMPHTTGLQKKFLSDLQRSLMGTLGKLPNSEFSEVAICLWTIDASLKNTDKLVNIIVSALVNIRTIASRGVIEPAIIGKLTRLMCLAGQFGKACNFETHLANVKSKVPSAKSDSVAGIIVETLAVFAHSSQPLPLRQAALQSICAVCQRWPKQFLRPDLGILFDSLLKNQTQVLEDVFLDGLLGFFTTQDITTSMVNDPEHGATGRERLAKTYVATDQDGATAALSQRYLQQILRLATSSVGGTALTATKLVSSIVRQGLPHPKECGPSLIALETSPNLTIAQIACTEHRSLHEKHESIIEKEYMRAMERALRYQEEVVGDAKGWTGEQPPTAKLAFFWDVLKAGKVKVRQKYLTNTCSKLIFEPTTTDLMQHLTFVRFIVENLAFFDYDKAEDLRLLMDSLAKSFATVGTTLAQKIETEVFNMTIESLSSIPSHDAELPVLSGQITPERLTMLAMSAQILLLVAETRGFLLRTWGGQKLLKKSSKEAKSLARSAHTATFSDAYIKRMQELCQPLLDDIAQKAICQKFSEVLSTDHDVRIEDDMDDDEDASEMARSPSGTPGGRKRKLSVGPGPAKKRGRPRKTPSFNRYDDDKDADGEWE